MKEIELPDGTIAEFPDDMSNDQIAGVLQKQFKPVPEPKSSGILQHAGNLAAGVARGVGSIYSTLAAPLDMIEGAAMGRGVNLDVNRERRAGIDARLQKMGAEPDSLMYQGGKLGGEIAGTLGVGPFVAGVARPFMSRAPNLLEAISTAGMKAGTSTGGANLLARTAGGAVTGGAAAGLVDPEFALTGGAIGGALPGALKVTGYGGNALRGMVSGPAQTPELARAIQAARGAGYVIPLSQARPSLLNRTMEGFAGKITTAQNASAKNQGVTDKLAARALGLPEDAAITPDALQAVKKTAGQAYEAIKGAGTITPGKVYSDALDAIAEPALKAAQGFPDAPPSPVLKLVDSLRSESFDSASAIEKIKSLRMGADDAFRTGNTEIGRAAKSAAKALEDAMEAHLQASGNVDLLKSFREARTLYAKAGSVEKAMNASTGTIDARKLAAQLQRGKPLSGELKQAAEFAGRFPKAAQVTEAMGSLPQTSPLDWALGGGLSVATMNPALMASVVARPAVRGLITSPLVQNRLVQGQPNALAALLANSGAGQIGYRSAPILGSGQ